MVNESRSYQLWLASIAGMTYARATTLLKFFDSPKAVYEATDKLIQATRLDFSATAIAAKATAPDQFLELLSKKSIDMISIWDNDYPFQLKEIYQPPVALYKVGRMPFSDLIKDSIAVVGSRQCSEYGVTTTVKIAKFLASQGTVLVSGMARGIDTYAHKGVLEGGGMTLAVLGCGVDICYPKENLALYEKIKENGAILSEYGPGVQPRPFHFPMRNRIISGLTLATVVVEAGLKSGSLITADCALEQGKEVFAVPGNITSGLSAGTNNLIKQGAYLLTDPQEIFQNIAAWSQAVDQDETQSGITIQSTVNITIEETQQQLVNKSPIIDSLTVEEKNIYDKIGQNPIEIDEIHRQTILDIQTINHHLTMLELKGILTRLPGNKYMRTTL